MELERKIKRKKVLQREVHDRQAMDKLEIK